ncbi:hypothetical protein, partial [Enterobacter sp. 56-7]|uniref:hypothetical protein n=1 Tax=Enterobacter sp. 56-7 TaxID=1895906 RepID=UPI00257AE50E
EPEPEAESEPRAPTEDEKKAAVDARKTVRRKKRLAELAALVEQGVITAEEFDVMRSSLAS